MRVIYVIEDMHIYKNDWKRFQLKYFEEKNILVEMWSVVRWTFKNCDEPADLYKSKNIFYINNNLDLIDNFERIKIDECVFLCYPYHSYTEVSYRIRRMIKKYGYDYCNISGSPAVGKQRLIVSKNKLLLAILQIFRFFKVAKDSLIKHNFTIFLNAIYGTIGPFLYSSKYNFITTELANAGFPNWIELSCKNKNIMIHSEGYDEYLDARDQVSEFKYLKDKYYIPDKYIVFVDDFEVGHSDFKKLGEKMPVNNRQEYLDLLNDFFSVIESKLNMPVVIAEHPKAEYKIGEFNGRISMKGFTNYLIYHSSFVIIGASTCIGMMIQCKKDYIGYYSSEFFENVPRLISTYKLVQETLGTNYVDIRNSDQLYNIDEYINTFSKEVYDMYINKYIIDKHGIYNKHFYEVVYNFMID